jgi:peptidyl-prolyl cis-trans isomerase SurA
MSVSRRCTQILATALLSLAAPQMAATGFAQSSAPAKPNKTTAALKSDKNTATKKPRKARSLSIAVLVNDQAITGYEIEQRAALLAMNSGGAGKGFKAKAERRWKKIISSEKTKKGFQDLLRKNKVQTKKEAQKLQVKYIKKLQKRMVSQLRREARAGAVAGSRKAAIKELIDEKLKLQEAKRLNTVVNDDEVEKILTGIAKRNKLTLEQFSKNMTNMGTNISTMRARFKAELSWRDVVRRRFGHQIAIAERDVDRLVASNPASDVDSVELKVQRITLPIKGKVNQKVIAARIADADSLAAKYTGCESTRVIAAGIPGANFSDMGRRKPSTLPEPTRSLLLNASQGDMLPPSVGPAGIELWTLCERKVVTGETEKRKSAQAELRQREFQILAKKHLKDLRQDAAIEYR